MSRCTIDHSLEDVLLKLNEQQAFIPKELYNSGLHFLDETRDQETLNDVFHLLKKYDLAEDEERERRNVGMQELFQQT